MNVKSAIVALLMMSIVPLCAMKNQESNVISDEELAAKKEAFALELKNRKHWKWEYLFYPKDVNIEIDEEVLSKELLGRSDLIIRFGNMFMIPAGMNEKFIHKTLVPEKRVRDFEIGF